MPIKTELPLGPWSRDLTGRYLNGVAAVEVAIAGGGLDFHIREFKVKGRNLPGYALEALEHEIRRSGALDGEELNDYVRRAGGLRIERGRIVITPKGT
jgi:hypothetical protein